MSSPLSFYRLQQIDSQIDQNQARLKAIHEALKHDREVQQAKAEVARAETEEHKTERELNQAESAVQAQGLKIEQSEASLYGGSVHNPKELQDLQNEVAALKRHLARLEDRQLEAMLAKETAEENHTEALDKMQAVLARRFSQKNNLSEEQTSIHKDLERLQAERGAVAGDLDDQALAQYEELRQDRRGIAVVAVSDGACSACGTTLTPAQLQAARSPTKIAHCPTCGRILYVT
jgi:predicted  nucleic acid-binding Zn-ribbon protein